jgi:hypothetical protein
MQSGRARYGPRTPLTRRRRVAITRPPEWRNPHVPRLPAIALALAVASILPAAAQQPPLAIPSRDVAVRYRVPNAPATSQATRSVVAEGRIRTEGRALTQRVIHLIDTRSGQVTAMLDRDRTFQDLGRVAPVMTMEHSFVRPNTRLTREGADRVAGLACTIWRVEPEGGSPEDLRRACITEDGVPLRLVEGIGADAETLYEATEVSYAPQDPAQFRVPAGYQAAAAEAPARRR